MFRVIAMPYELARRSFGVGRGPEHLLERGAEDALRSRGAGVETEILEFTGDFSSEIDTSFDLIAQVSTRVEHRARGGCLSGDLVRQLLCGRRRRRRPTGAAARGRLVRRPR